jgi:drug/metabolite transporter (DMT)-like permease
MGEEGVNGADISWWIKFAIAVMVDLVDFSFGRFLFVIPFGANQFLAVQWSNFSLNDSLSAIYVVLGTTFLAYLLNIFALKSLSPTVASSYIYLQPLMAGLFAWLFASMMREDYSSDITWIKAGCAGMIFAGVYLVSSPVIRKTP